MVKSVMIKNLMIKFGVALTALTTVGLVAMLSSGEPKWKLVWSDDFSGTVLDGDKWVYDVGVGQNGWGEYQNLQRLIT